MVFLGFFMFGRIGLGIEMGSWINWGLGRVGVGGWYCRVEVGNVDRG